MKARLPGFACLLFFSLSAFAQAWSAEVSGPATSVEVTAHGVLKTVTFHRIDAGCSSAATIELFHRSGTTLTRLAERGPFAVTDGETDVTLPLDPPVAVEPGDLLRVRPLAPCVNPAVPALSPMLLALLGIGLGAAGIFVLRR